MGKIGLVLILVLITGCQPDLNTKIEMISEVNADGKLVIGNKKLSLCGVKIINFTQTKEYFQSFIGQEVGVVYSDSSSVEVFINLGETPEIFLNEQLIARGLGEAIAQNCPNQKVLDNI